MSKNESSEDDLQRWLDALTLGELDAKGAEELRERLRADPAARIAYLESVSFEALLQREFPRQAGIIEKEEVLTGSVPLELEKRRVPYQRPWSQWAAAAAVVILSASIAIYLLIAQSSFTHFMRAIRSSDPRLSVATITNFRDAVPAGGKKPFSRGQRVVRGSFALASGSVELTFDCGAVVVLEGPARLALESEYRTKIESGRLRADVPHQAIGFLIETPGGTVRDLGTAFGVDVARNGKTELHVLQGKVETLESSGAKSVSSLVAANEAVRLMASAKPEPVVFHPEEFDAHLPVKPPPLHPAGVHWSFDPPGSATQASAGEQYHLELKRAGELDPSPAKRFVAGVFGSALAFNGQNETALSDYRGIAGYAPRTVAAWVRIPRDARLDHPNGIIAWGRFAPGEKWQLATNINREDGTIGALRQEFGFGYIIGSTDLRDGAWHHVAAVFHGGPNTDVTTDVKLYVDGRLEILSGQKAQNIVTAAGSEASLRYAAAPVYPVMLGKYLPGGTSPKSGEAFPWRGDLDELHIFVDALTPAQIVSLMTKNTLD